MLPMLLLENKFRKCNSIQNRNEKMAKRRNMSVATSGGGEAFYFRGEKENWIEKRNWL